LEELWQTIDPLSTGFRRFLKLSIVRRNKKPAQGGLRGGALGEGYATRTSSMLTSATMVVFPTQNRTAPDSSRKGMAVVTMR
jgi:hypothetical protein